MTCSREGCERKVHGKGLCSSHYQRQWRAANPGKQAQYHIPMNPTPLTTEAFMAKVEVRGDGCWEWQGRTNAKGYGQVYSARVKWQAHRWAYAHLPGGGELIDGHHLHHQCGNGSCVRPDHLIQVTQDEHAKLHDHMQTRYVASL